jgi:thioredoxin reductase (NADPH)
VSACAVCDGALFRNEDVVVIGGGDTAMEEASYLAGLCKSVTLIHRRDEFRASKTMIARVVENPKIKILYSHVVEEVLGEAEDKVTGLVVKNLKNGEKNTIGAAAMFVAIGHTPMTDLFVGQLETHANGYLKTVPGSTRTSVEGVFAAGDVQDWTFRQAVTAAGTGCMAALEAERWLRRAAPRGRLPRGGARVARAAPRGAEGAAAAGGSRADPRCLASSLRGAACA